jgi:hypothetical protein
VAPRKKRIRRGSQNPNTVLVIFLIFFILATLFAGVFAWYGYSAKALAEKKADDEKTKAVAAQKARDWTLLQSHMVRQAMGGELLYKEGTTDEPNDWENVDLPNFDKDSKLVENSKFKEEPNKAVVEAAFKKAKEDLGWDGKRFRTNYREKFKKSEKDLETALAERATALGQQAALQAQLKKAQEAEVEIDGKKVNFYEWAKNRIETGNKAALDKAAEKTGAVKVLEDEIVTLRKTIADVEKDTGDKLRAKEGEVLQLREQKAKVERQLTELTKDPKQKGAPNLRQAGQVHALFLDMSPGKPLWDTPQGKVVRIDPRGRHVYINVGKAQGARPQLTFMVFGKGSNDRPDGRLRGTIEVQEVLDNNTSLCRITSIYDAEGNEVPLHDPRRGVLTRQGENPMKDGDLIYNLAWGSHVAIAGSINWSGAFNLTPAEQRRDLLQFMALLKKNGVTVDAYIDMMDGKVKGEVTDRTNYLIRGELPGFEGGLDKAPPAIKAIYASAKKLRADCVEHGVFIISSANFLTVIGYRPPRSGDDATVSEFRSRPTAAVSDLTTIRSAE